MTDCTGFSSAYLTHAPVSCGSASGVDLADSENLKHIIVEIYQITRRHCPEREEDLPALLRNYRGREDELLLKLRARPKLLYKLRKSYVPRKAIKALPSTILSAAMGVKRTRPTDASTFGLSGEEDGLRAPPASVGAKSAAEAASAVGATSAVGAASSLASGLGPGLASVGSGVLGGVGAVGYGLKGLGQGFAEGDTDSEYESDTGAPTTNISYLLLNEEPVRIHCTPALCHHAVCFCDLACFRADL